MAANVGRTITVYWGDDSPQIAVAGIREKGITLSGEAVDITNDDSNGWRELLDAPQMNTVELSASGVLLNDTLRQDWFSGASATGSRMQAATFEYPLETGDATPARITGNFYLQEYAETGNHDGEITFEATFASSGVVTYTPAA
jgi:predicted secreted protein